MDAYSGTFITVMIDISLYYFRLIKVAFTYRRLKPTQKQQLFLFVTMAYMYGETHGSTQKLRFVLPMEDVNQIG